MKKQIAAKMERAQEFMKEYEKFKSGFMKKYLSDSKESSDHEPEYEYISANEEEDADCDRFHRNIYFARIAVIMDLNLIPIHIIP